MSSLESKRDQTSINRELIKVFKKTERINLAYLWTLMQKQKKKKEKNKQKKKEKKKEKL